MTSTFTPFATARETLEVLDNLVTASGVAPTERVAATRAELARIATLETDLLGEIRALAPADPGVRLEDLAERFVERRISAADAVAELAAEQRSTGKSRQALTNKVTFRTARAAGVELRRLGDGVITDVLQPWLARAAGELLSSAVVVDDAGWAAVLEARVWAEENQVGRVDLTDYAALRTPAVVRHLAVLRAELRVAEMHRAWAAADELRARGIVPAVADGSVTPLRYRWTSVHRLPDLSGLDREPLFTCRAVVAEAGPTVATATEAQATPAVA